MTTLPKFNFDGLVQSLTSSRLLNPEFKQVILKNVAIPTPVKQGRTEPSTKGSVTQDYPFSSLFVDSGDWTGLSFDANDIASNVSILSAKIQNMFEGAKPNTYYSPQQYSVLLFSDADDVEPTDPNSTVFRSHIPIIYHLKNGKGIYFHINGSPIYTVNVTQMAVKVEMYFLKGGMRVKLKFASNSGKKYDITFPYGKSEVYGSKSNPLEILNNAIDKIYNHIWNTENAYRNDLFNVDVVKQTLVSRSALLDDDETLSEVVASRVADNLIKPYSTLTMDDLDKLPLGCVLNVGSYILAKYSTPSEDLYNVIDLSTGNYTDKAFDQLNLQFYAQSEGFSKPIILVDPNESPDTLAIISKYNMLYPSVLMYKLIRNFQFKGQDFQFTSPLLTYAIGSQVSAKEEALNLLVKENTGSYMIDELGERYVILPSSDKTKPNKIKRDTKLSSLKADEIENLFNTRTLRWLAFNAPSATLSIDKIYGDMGLLSQYSYTGILLKSTDFLEVGENSNNEIQEKSQFLKNSYVWQKKGASINIVIGGFGAYAILIDKKKDGTPFFMLQYLKQNTSTFRMVLSNQINPSTNEPYWVTGSSKQNGFPTATVEFSSDNFIPYTDQFAMPTIDDAIEMIVTHLYQTIKTGYSFITQADPFTNPNVKPVTKAYYFGSGKNWVFKSVTIPSKLDGIVCGALLVIPKTISQEAQVFLIKQNNQWSIPMMNLTVGENVEDCALDAFKSIFSTVPEKMTFSGASLSSVNKSDKSKVFNTVFLQVSEANAKKWTPTIVQGVKISGYAWVDASNLTSSEATGTIQWSPTILDELGQGQDYILSSRTSKDKKSVLQSVLGAWIKHSSKWVKSAPIDPRLSRLVDPINLEQMKKFEGLYFDGVKYPYLSPPDHLFVPPQSSDLIPIQQRIAGYKTNPKRNTVKLMGYRKNGLGSVFRYEDRSLNHLIRLNPRVKSDLNLPHSVLRPYTKVVQKVLGVKNPSKSLLESAYALDMMGFPLQNAKRNPKDNSVLTLNLDETEAVVQFADVVKLAVGGSQSSAKQKMSDAQLTELGIPSSEWSEYRDKQKTLQYRIFKSQENRVGTPLYDPESENSIGGQSLPQWARYIPLLRVMGLWQNSLDIGDRVVNRGIGTAIIALLGENNSFQANEWSYGQLASMKKHFPQQASNLSDDLSDAVNLANAVRLWIRIQTGTYNGMMLIRDNLNPEWYPVPFVPDNEIKLSVKENTLDNRNNTKDLPKPIKVPKLAVTNPEYNVEGFWLDMFQYTYAKATHTGFSSNIVWQFDWNKGQTLLMRSNTRDPRFTNKPLMSSTESKMGIESEKEVMFVYPDKTPLTLQIVGVSTSDTSTSSSNLIYLSRKQRYAWVDARPAYRKEPYPKGQFSDFIKKI
jgi:hypothetical protein